jgi:hypothetical protein
LVQCPVSAEAGHCAVLGFWFLAFGLWLEACSLQLAAVFCFRLSAFGLKLAAVFCFRLSAWGCIGPVAFVNKPLAQKTIFVIIFAWIKL